MSIFTFQCLDCYVNDANILEEEPEEEEKNVDNFVVHMFGKTEEGKSVALNVTNYTPYIYVQYNEKFNNDLWHGIIFELLQKQLIKWEKKDDTFVKVLDSSEHVINGGLHKHKNVWGYNFEKESDFLKLYFKSLTSYKKLKYLLQSCHSNTLSVDEMQLFYNIASKLDYQSQYMYIKEYTNKYLDDNEKVHTECRTNMKKCKECLGKFRTMTGLLKFIIKLGKNNLPFEFAQCKLYDVIDPILRFAHEKDLNMASWVNVTNWTVSETKLSSCDIEYTVDYNDISRGTNDMICQSIKEMAFDIEAYSKDDMFPSPEKEDDVVYQIGITLKEYSDKQARRILLHLSNNGRIENVPVKEVCIRNNENSLELCKNKLCLKSGHILSKVDIKVENYETEMDLLLRFVEIIQTENPDLIYGYNSDGFDWRYLMVRAEVNHCFDEFCKLSRLLDYNCKVVEKKFQSSAYGDNTYYRVDIPGRLNIDLMIWIQRNMPVDRYPDYKLDTIAEKEINQKKHDISFKDIFRAYRIGDKELLTKIGDYCLQDTILVQRLINKLDVVTQLFEMSNLTSVPVSYLLSKGQQIKCFSIICKDAMSKNFVVPYLDIRDEDSFTGAIVLEPKTGFFDTPIAVLDFASLYPSIQVAFKICYSTIVLDPKLYNKLKELKEQNKPLEINETKFDFIEWDDNVIKYTSPETNKVSTFSSVDSAKNVLKIKKKDIQNHIKSGNGPFEEAIEHYLFFFAQNKDSIIPDLQVTLKSSRKKVKKMMGLIENSENSEDQLRYRVLNGRQLAIKVTMNSIYGFTSAFMLNMSSLSACVTGRGRQMIEMTKNFMENEFEKIAKKNYWTKEDTMIYYNDVMKEVITDKPEPSWIRKFPTAVEDEPWTRTNLQINVVGGDTDSVFCNFPNSSMEETISLNHKAEVILTDKIFNRNPIEMEYEKTYCPMVIVKKKNYIGVKYEMNPNKWKIDFKGIAVKRRNYCNKVKEIYWNIIYPILGVEMNPQTKKYEKVTWDVSLGPKKAIESLKRDLDKLVAFEQDVNENHTTPDKKIKKGTYDDFIISASLKSSYKSENLPHVQLAKRMNERDSSSGPKSGQRFGYIIVNEDTRDNELYAKSEDPEYAYENGLSLDYIFYLDNQIRKPITSFLALTGKINQVNKIFNDTQMELFNNLKRKRHKIELEARRDFFDPNKKIKQIAPLKKPKKQTVAKKDRVKQVNTLDSFFGI